MKTRVKNFLLNVLAGFIALSLIYIGMAFYWSMQI